MIIGLIIAIVLAIMPNAIVIPATPKARIAKPFVFETVVSDLQSEYESGCACDECYWTECFDEALSEFDATYAQCATKRAKNGALMVKGSTNNRYRFASK